MSIAFLYINNERLEKEIKEKITFATATKRIKYLGINLPKKAKDLYLEKYDTDEKTKDYTNRRRDSSREFLDWKDQICENNYTTKSNLQIQCNPYQITKSIFHRLE